MERKEVIERCGKERGRTGCFGTREVRGEQKKRSPASLRGHCKLARVHSLSDLAGTRLLSRFMNRLYGSHVPAECGDRYCTACVCVCVYPIEWGGLPNFTKAEQLRGEGG